jgi:NAD(P)-dependent dehydrogenase (short-subunit alcohol dehydrogenase family)/acyl dehydratase
LTLQFGEEHLRCFSAASLDFNPSHLSESYARRTSSGQRVVYGILGLLASLRYIRLPAQHIPSEVRIDFKGPLFLNVDYTISVEQEDSSGAKVVLRDGSASLLRARLRFQNGAAGAATLPETGIAARQTSRTLDGSDLERLPAFQGTYSPGRASYQKLLELLGADSGIWGDALPLAALCSSYMTGMELPGERAIYSGLRLKIPRQQIRTPFTFHIAVDSYDTQFGLTQAQFALADATGTWADGRISAIARPPRSASLAAPIEAGSGRFTGIVALIIGASRGLGAAMALELAAEGANVVGVYAQSQEDADAVLAASRHLPGCLAMERGDASDLNWCGALKSRVAARFGRLDLLVCNAAPALQPLRIEEACYERIQAYLVQGFALVGAPLSSFLEPVSASRGSVLLISSSAVEEPPAVWPHYVALKAAAEGLVRTAAVANPEIAFWIARPGRLLTDLTDTPMGRLDAETPQSVARRILEQSSGRAAFSGVRFCR